MAAVSPQIFPSDTVVDVEGEETLKPCLLFVKCNQKEDDDKIAPTRTMTIEEGLRPLLVSMKLVGLYVSRPSPDAGYDQEKKSPKWNAYKIYAVAVAILLWINSVRFFSAFTHEDRFGLILFNKLIGIIWSIQCAISQTAFYTASFSGRLAVVFNHVLDGTCAKGARKVATFCTVAAWSIVVSGMAFFAYLLNFSNGLMDSAVAPFQNHIAISHPLVPRIIASFISFYLMSAYIFSQATTFVLAMIFSHQFKAAIDLLSYYLDNHERRVSDKDIETLRQRHQEISINVSNVDDSLMFSNASAFCCQVFCLVVLLYTLVFYHSFVTDAVVIISFVFWMIMFAIGLVLTATGGIIVHHYVS